MRGTTWDSDTDKHENHWRRTFCQIPFPAIYEHADNGKRSLHRLVEFFKRKAETERSASEELRSVVHTPIDSTTSPHLDDLEEPGYSIRRALSEVKNYVDATSHQQMLLARVLEEQVAEPLVSLQDASEMYIRTLQGEIRNVNTAYEEALQTHAQAAARLRKAVDEGNDAKDRQRTALHGIGVPAFELQRLAARVAKCEDEIAQAELAKAQAKTVLYNRIVSRDEMAMAVSVAYQKAEEERLDQLNSCLQRFVHIEKERVRAAEKMLSSLENHITNVSRAEDIQLLIHNHRNRDNMHFQGKALALLDWHWNKMVAEKESAKLSSSHGQQSTPKSPPRTTAQVRDSFTDSIIIPPNEVYGIREDIGSPRASTAMERSPHGALADSPMGRAIRDLFATDSQPGTPTQPPMPTLPRIVSDISLEDSGGEGVDAIAAAIELEIDETANALAQVSAETPPAPTDEQQIDTDSGPPSLGQTLKSLVESSCHTHKGRALFVKCLNRQRSLETRVKDKASFDILVECFRVLLDYCKQDDDVKPAKTTMILAETFYLDRKAAGLPVEPEPPRRERGGSWGFAQHTMNRGATRMYLQEEVKTHEIWTNPGFWEKALLLAIGEELHRTPQPCAWEDLPSGIARTRNHSSSSDRLASLAMDGGIDGGVGGGGGGTLYTREEAVSRVHNIVFGQLGSFTLSMLEFEVPFIQIESFVETMCDAHELTEDQRFELRKNLQEVFATLK